MSLPPTPDTSPEPAVEYVTDSMGSVICYADGKKVASVWGPAVEGDWFVHVRGWAEVRRVPTKDEAIALLPKSWVSGGAA